MISAFGKPLSALTDSTFSLRDRRSDILWPQKSAFGSRDYLKIFSDDESWFSGHGEFFAGFMMPVVA
ncbi:BQ5605_C048g12405 [Microbotryum silenes-dioicae]|uniref:BQ5605_C048g12405 protein n=1 Tax=Microbotryum silenes-dioicae TaxID=796604 RepID=A0A2X0MPK5_9BASI|nr:BQ5605_C048g12405 [Microbotryum silenes-dioicae]